MRCGPNGYSQWKGVFVHLGIDEAAGHAMWYRTDWDTPYCIVQLSCVNLRRLKGHKATKYYARDKRVRSTQTSPLPTYGSWSWTSPHPAQCRFRSRYGQKRTGVPGHFSLQLQGGLRQTTVRHLRRQFPTTQQHRPYRNKQTRIWPPYSRKKIGRPGHFSLHLQRWSQQTTVRGPGCQFPTNQQHHPYRNNRTHTIGPTTVRPLVPTNDKLTGRPGRVPMYRVPATSLHRQ